MKKWSGALLIVVYSLTMLACGTNSSSSSPASAGNSASGGEAPGPPGGGSTGGSGGGSGSGGGGNGGNCGAATADFFVATNGNDSWTGTLDTPASDNSDGPFATLDRARKAIQGMPGGKHRVMVRAGSYFLTAPLVFSSSDSGTVSTPIVYEAYPCETPILSGGQKITGWTKGTGNTWTAKLSPVGYQNFEGLFYNGQRRYRPRTTLNSYLLNAGPVYTSSSSANCSVAVSGQYECFDRFFYSNTDIASNYHSLALGDVEILDFEKWTMSRLRLQSVDTVNHIAYLTGPTIQDSINNGFMTGHRYLVENVKEAFNQPGQWYLDRCANPPTCNNSSGTWTLSYIAQAGENPATDEIIAPQQSQLLIASGLQYVTFRGITFSHDNWLPGSAGLGDSQGSPTVTAALSFTNSSNVVFDGVTISHTSGWGLEFVGDDKGNTANNQLINSALFDLGGGGLRVGKHVNFNDTESNIPQYNLIQNNVIASGGRVMPTGIGTGVWIGNSHHNTITHNEIYDFYNGAIRIGYNLNISSGAGNAHDNIASYNLLYNLGQGVTSDMGGIYFATSATTGNQAVNNVIHDVTHNWQNPDGYGAHGIYFDQGSSNVVARNNLVYRISGAGFFQNFSDSTSDTYPQNNVVDNNIFALGNKTIQRGGDNPSSFSFTHNIVYYDLAQVQGGKWSCYDVGKSGVSVPCSTRFVLDYNTYWDVAGGSKFITTVPPAYSVDHWSLSEWQNLGEDLHSVMQDPLFVNPSYPNDDYTLQSGSPALATGFVPFDTKGVGRTSTDIVVPDVPAAFPLQVMDPSSY